MWVCPCVCVCTRYRLLTRWLIQWEHEWRQTKRWTLQYLKNVLSNIPVNTLTCWLLLSHLYRISSSTACWEILREAFTLPRCQVKYIKLCSANLIFPIQCLLCLLLLWRSMAFWTCNRRGAGWSNWKSVESMAEIWQDFYVAILTSLINIWIRARPICWLADIISPVLACHC